MSANFLMQIECLNITKILFSTIFLETKCCFDNNWHSTSSIIFAEHHNAQTKVVQDCSWPCWSFTYVGWINSSARCWHDAYSTQWRGYSNHSLGLYRVCQTMLGCHRRSILPCENFKRLLKIKKAVFQWIYKCTM